MSNTIDSTSTVRGVIRGALRAWGVLELSAFLNTNDQTGLIEIHDAAGRLMASVCREASPLGPLWLVGLSERRERTFPSVVAALRYLRGHLCPEREAGRVLFGQGENR